MIACKFVVNIRNIIPVISLLERGFDYVSKKFNRFHLRDMTSKEVEGAAETGRKKR